MSTFLADGRPLTWVCLDAAAIGDIAYSSARMLRRVRHDLQARNIGFCLTDVAEYVREELRDYQDPDIAALLGPDTLCSTPADAVEAYRQSAQGHGQASNA